jgi:pyruvate kinase
MLGHYTTGLPRAHRGAILKAPGNPRGGAARLSGEPMPLLKAAGTHTIRRTRILATLGPASSSPKSIRRLLLAGADAVRINFSHGTPVEQQQLIRRARAAASALRREIAIVADIQGPKLRVGIVEHDSVELREGRRLRLDSNPAPGDVGRLSISVPQIRSAARVGDPLLLGDGNVELRVERVSSDSLLTRVVQGGTVHSHQGIYLPRASLRGAILGPKDLEDLTVAVREGCDFVAVSFVGSAKDVRQARTAIERRTDAPVGIIAKIERASALGAIDGILREAQGIMVARGDLGIEVPLERLAIEQKKLVAAGQRAGRQTIVATQMLLSMVSAPRPTRAEATDVANAVLDGADAVMLSEESAIGKFPELAVVWLDRIARATEGSISREAFRTPPEGRRGRMTEDAVAEAAVRTAEAIGAGAIVVPTHSGRTAHLVSRLRPTVPILALSRLESTRRRLALAWGVQTDEAPPKLSLEQLRRLAESAARHRYALARGRPLVMTAGYPVEGRPTNLVMVTET